MKKVVAASIVFLVLLLTTPALAGVYESVGPWSLPDLSTNTFSITVTDQGVVDDLDVKLSSFSHTFAGDLQATIEHVDTGTVVQLFDAAGGATTLSGDHIFDDEATGTFPEPGTGGNWVPDGLLSGFDGEDIAGTWELTITDINGGDVGSLGAWSIDADVSAVPEPGTFVLMLVGGCALAFASRRRRNRKQTS